MTTSTLASSPLPELPEPLRQSFRRISAATADGTRPPITRQHVSRVLRGVSKPSAEVAERLAKVGGISVDELLAYLHSLRYAGTQIGVMNTRLLSEEQVGEIQELNGNGEGCRELAVKYEVSHTTISMLTREVPRQV